MKIKPLFLVLVIVLTLITNAQVQGSDSQPVKADRIIIYMITRLTWNDLSPHDTPNLWELKNQGGAGLLNPLSGGAANIDNLCCTISAGNLAVGSAKSQLNYQAGETVNGEIAGEVYLRNTGVEPQDHNLVVNTINSLQKVNHEKELGSPGLLGDNLHSNGFNTVVIGNSDRPGYPSRYGMLILMDSRGIVDYGFVSEAMTNGNAPPDIPWSSNYPAIISEVNKYGKGNVILLEFGDLDRLESTCAMYSPAMYNRQRKLILSRIDTCIGAIQKQNLARTCVYVINPAPSGHPLYPDDLLTPLIIVKPGIHGTLASYSTHREGIVSSISIKDSLLSCISPATQDAIYSTYRTDDVSFLDKLDKQAVFRWANQDRIMSVLSYTMGLLALLGAIRFLKGKRDVINKIMFLVVLSFPLGLLIMPITGITDNCWFITVTLLINILLAVLAMLAARILRTNAVLILLGATIALILYDLFTGTGLISNSIMSYQLIHGVRFYGLGNEYTGVLIGAVIAFASIFLTRSAARWRGLIIAGIFSGVIFFIGYPTLGIDVGGVIAACIALSYTYLLFKEIKIDTGKIIGIAAATALIILAIAWIDLHQSPELRTHFANNILLIINGGMLEALNMLSRKLTIWLHVLNYSVLGWMLLTGIIVSAYIMLHSDRLFLPAFHFSPFIFKGMKGIVVAAMVEILCNDTGLTAAATLVIYFIILSVYPLEPVKETPR